MRKIRTTRKQNSAKISIKKGNSKSSAAIKALSAAALAGIAVISTNPQAQAADTSRVETDRIIVTEANQTITGNYQNQKWTASQGEWYNEWSVLGGVIQNKSEGLTIDNANFDNNAVYTHGDDADWMQANGGVLNNVEGATITAIKNSSFTNNLAQDIEPGAPTAKDLNAKGGAIYNSGTITTIDNVKFEGNIAKADTKHTYTDENGQQKTVTGSYNSYGGAIVNDEHGTIETITNSSFKNNQATWHGGAIYNSGTITSVNNTDFEGNSAKYGGAIHLNSGKIDEIKTVNFKENSGLGSAILINNGGHISKIDDTTFEKNTATNVGGTIHLDNGTIGELTNSKFIDNTGNSGAALYLINGSSINKLDKVTFENNTSSSNGGAIYLQNQASLGDISNSIFKNNHFSSSGGHNGGAIYLNDGTSIGMISDTIFDGNVGGAQGGAIYLNGSSYYNDKTPSKIAGLTNVVFKNNSAGSLGGAIYANDNSEIGNMTNVTFENNYSIRQGGAIWNQGTIGDWNGGHIYGSGEEHISTQGAGIWNLGKIGNISNIEIKDTYANNLGGAIYNVWGGNNKGIGDLTNVSFTNTIVKSSNSGGQGGAIFNSGTIGNLTNVTFDKAGIITTSNSYGQGGVIMNTGTIGNWTNGFAHGLGKTENVINSGAGIFNSKTFGDITNVEFKDFYVTSYGAAIANDESMGTIKNSSFINNHAIGNNYSNITFGGAIRNTRTLGGIIDSYFENNTSNRFGGAICSEGTITNGIQGSVFKNNQSGDGGAIWTGYNTKALKDLYFEGNRANGLGEVRSYTNSQGITTYSKDAWGRGGAIYWAGSNRVYNSETHTYEDVYYPLELQGSNIFKNNYAKQGGGAIWAEAGMGVISDSYFEGNVADSLGGAILIWNKTIDGIKNSTFINNKTGYELPEEVENAIAYGSGGAIWVNEKLGDIENSYFEGNETVTKYESQYDLFGQGGAIYAPHDIGKISNSTFKNNIAGNSGGAIWTSGSIDKIANSLFIGNHANTAGGAIMHYGFNFDTGENYKATFENTSFLNNTAEKGRGGAIQSTGDLDIVADKGDVIFSGNKDSQGENDIYLDTTTGIDVNVISKNNGNVEFHGGIDASHEYNLKINGDSSSRVLIDNDIKMANMTIDNTNVYSYTPSFITSNPSVSVNSGTLNFTKLNNEIYNFNNLSNTGTINIGSVDIDVAGEKMGIISADNYGNMSGTINVNSLNVMTDPVKDKTNIFFADKSFANSVQYNGAKEYYAPIYKYGVSYLSNTGEFQFIRGGGAAAGSPNSFNPAVLAPSANVQAGANATMNETFKYVFEHADAFTQLPQMERLSIVKNNQYAISTDFNNNLGSLAPEFNNKAGWLRPYATFEKMNLKNGPKVNATSYGSVLGFDSNFQDLGKGWTGLTTGYIGYNGSQLRYQGADTTMNGGILGLTETFYKGNFWTALTVSAGASVGETRTMYGKEDFTSLMAGVGSKTGYNFEFKEGKYIIQPIMFMSYTFVNTFDYTNAAGVKMNMDPAHSIQLNPSIRFIANTKNDWQPYASVGMVWNVMNQSNVTANNVKLPEMSIKPYVEYGLGVQKRFKDKYTAFGQAMLRSGGRNGITLTLGFRWNLGKEGKPINEKVEKVNKNLVGSSELTQDIQGQRKVLKQLSNEQKIVLGKQLNTTRTTSSALLKQL